MIWVVRMNKNLRWNGLLQILVLTLWSWVNVVLTRFLNWSLSEFELSTSFLKYRRIFSRAHLILWQKYIEIVWWVDIRSIKVVSQYSQYNIYGQYNPWCKKYPIMINIASSLTVLIYLINLAMSQFCHLG